MYKYTAVIAGLGAIALGAIAGHILDVRTPRVSASAAGMQLVASIDIVQMPWAMSLEIADDANGALAADYSWQRWPSVTDF
jgi:hypothetical protein